MISAITSLSRTNPKPWDIIEKRLALAAEADLATPASYESDLKSAPPHKAALRALELLRQYRSGRNTRRSGADIGRAGGDNRGVMTLGALTPGDVDMRTVVIIGSSHARRFARPDGERMGLYAALVCVKKPDK